MTHQLHHLLIQRNSKGNEIDSLHHISDDLITGLLLQGRLGEVVHADLVPSCSHTPVTSSLPHMPALSFPVLLVSDGPSGSLSHPPPPGPRMPLPYAPMLLGSMIRRFRRT